LTRYEYDGPDDMSRTPLSVRSAPKEKAKAKQTSKTGKAATKQASSTMDPILQNVMDLSKHCIENMNMVGKQQVLQTSIISILRKYEAQKINAGGTSADNT
jgi:hypothetical protein